MPQIIKDKRFIVLFSIIIFLIVGGFCFWNLNLKSVSVSAAGENWLTGWGYRKLITVNNASTSLTDYQVKVDISNSFYNETGLIDSWHMNEASGTVASDTSGSSNNGAVTGTTVVAGRYGNARSFSGSSKVQMASPVLTGTGDFTIESWIYPTVSGGTDYITGNYGLSNTGGLEFYKNGASNFFGVYIGGQSITSSTAVNLNAWNHVVVTRTSGAGVLYLNGVACGSGTISNSIVGSLNWTIGNGPDYTSEAFDGNIDEVKVYNRALLASEISAQYNAPKARLDYGDIRFTSSNGNTELPYWMEKDGTFWVKVPSLVSGNNTIYMYYSNSSALTTANGDNTFVFFDDFAGTTVNASKWVKTDASGYISQNGVLTISNGTAVWGGVEMHSVPNFNRADGLVVQGRYKSTMVTGASYKDTTMLWVKDSGAGVSYTDYIYAFYPYEYSGAVFAMYEDGTNRTPVSGTFTANTQYVFRQIVDTNTGAITQSSADGGLTWTTNYTSTYSTETPFKVGFTHYQGGNVLIDDVIVRKYVSSEPTTSFGVEEASVCSATGGTVTQVGGYCVHTFTTSGTFVPNGNLNLEYLVVAGGGGGGAGAGGGGGGGGFKTGALTVPNSSIPVTVGAGGDAPLWASGSTAACDKPFFLYFATHDIHVPRVPNDSFRNSSQCGLRCDAIQEFDWSVGQVMETLDRLKLTNDTLLIVTSDNGPVVDDGYADGSVEKLNGHTPAGPLKGGKYSLYEGGTRMPFIARWPGRIKPGVSDVLVCQVDFLASFAALAGQKIDASAGPDSLNVLPALLGESKKGREYLVEHAGGLALRKGEWKLIPKRTQAKKEIPTELYNLKSDIGETKNVAAENPKMVEEMTAELEKVKSAGRSRA